MATTRVTSNMIGRENVDAVVGKAAVTNRPMTRTALGNISNNATVVPDTRKGLKDAINKPARVLTKSKATTELKKVEKENSDISKTNDARSVSSPCPMDMSTHEISTKPAHVYDIDKHDGDNPQLVSEYVNDVYLYMRDLERTYSIKSRYLEGREINGRMRGILIDWLVQVHMRFHLLQETLYLTVAIIDRFLQEKEVSRNRLQLVGVTSMLIASKYEEMYAPEIGDFEYITDNAYQKSDIRKMECLILKTLDFNLGRPLPLHFLRRNSKAGEVDATKHNLAKYLMELTIVDYDMVHIHPSEIAAAALCMSMKLLDNSKWTDTLHYYSKYSETELLPIMKRMANLVLKAGSGKLTAVYTKYKGAKFMKISTIPQLQSESKIIQDLAEGNL